MTKQAARGPVSSGHAGTAQDAATKAALDWFARLRAGDVTEADRRAHEVWRTADPAHAAAYARVVALWDSPEFGAAVIRAAAVRKTVATSPRRRRMRWAAAAVLVLAIGLGAALGVPRHAMTRLAADLATAVGEQRRVTLADGSTLLLNTDSAAAFHFDAAHRGVRLLAGEAFFDVATDAARPFEVTAGPALVRVVGTAFAVRRYGEAAYVSVLRGAVQVAATNPAADAQQTVRLQPGDSARVTAQGVESRGRIDVDGMLAWRDGRLVFRDRPLGQVLREVARYHPGWIVIADDHLKRVSVSGNYRLADPVMIVDSLAEAVGARAIHVTDRLIVLRAASR